MKLKTVSLVIGALAAASAGVYVASRPAPAVVTDARVGASVLPADKAEKAAGLLISDQGKTVLLSRQPDGGWIVPSYNGFPADFQKLSQFIDELLRTKVDRFVSANPERLSHFEFKDTRIVLSDAEGKPVWGVTLGRSTETGARLLKFDGEEKAYQARLNAWLDPEPKSWADSSLVGLKADEVSRLEISFPGGSPLVLTRAKKEDPFRAEGAPAGMQAAAAKVGPLLGALCGLRYSDTVAPDDAQARESAAFARSVKLTCFDGRNLTVTLARRPERKIPKALGAAKQGEAGSTSALAAAAQAVQSPDAAKEPVKPGADLAKEETVPAGPVFVSVASSDPKAPVNAMMQKRAFQAYEYAFTSLPSKPDELLEPETKKE